MKRRKSRNVKLYLSAGKRINLPQNNRYTNNEMSGMHLQLLGDQKPSVELRF